MERLLQIPSKFLGGKTLLQNGENNEVIGNYL